MSNFSLFSPASTAITTGATPEACTMVLICTSLMISNTEHLSMGVFIICTSCSVQLFQACAYFLIGLFSTTESSLDVLNMNVLLDLLDLQLAFSKT